MSSPIIKKPADLIAVYGSALQSENLEEILKLYREDSEIIPDGASSLSGLSNIRDFYISTFASIKIEGELKVKSVDEWGDVAVVRCEEPATVVAKDTGVKQDSYFREIFVLVKKSGAWGIHRYMFSAI